MDGQKLFGPEDITTVGNITEDAIKEYIQQQKKESKEKILEDSLF